MTAAETIRAAAAPSSAAYQVLPETGRVLVRAREPDLAATTRALQQLARDPAFASALASGRGVLVDLGDVERLPAKLEVEGLALCLAGLRRRYRGGVALVATRTPVFGRVRRAVLFAAAHGFPLEAFRTAERAERWLDDAAR